MAGGEKEVRKLRPTIPNAKKLYSEEDLIYGKDDGRFYKPHHPVLSFAKNAVGEAAVKLIKRYPASNGGKSILGEAWNAHWDGVEKTYNAKKHAYAQAAFRNPIPVANKLVQNLWPLYHMKDGLTTMDSVYTVKRGGTEYLIHIAKDGEKADVSKLKATADASVGKEADIHNQFVSAVGERKFEDKEVTNSGIYKELTQGDVESRGLLDIGEVTSGYHVAELWLFGKKGSKSLAGKASDGAEIYRYSKPSATDFIGYYGHMDILYTVLSMAAAPAELVLTDQALQNIYRDQVGYSITSVIGKQPHPYLQMAA